VRCSSRLLADVPHRKGGAGPPTSSAHLARKARQRRAGGGLNPRGSAGPGGIGRCLRGDRQGGGRPARRSAAAPPKSPLAIGGDGLPHRGSRSARVFAETAARRRAISQAVARCTEGSRLSICCNPFIEHSSTPTPPGHARRAGGPESEHRNSRQPATSWRPFIGASAGPGTPHPLGGGLAPGPWRMRGHEDRTHRRRGVPRPWRPASVFAAAIGALRNPPAAPAQEERDRAGLGHPRQPWAMRSAARSCGSTGRGPYRQGNDRGLGASSGHQVIEARFFVAPLRPKGQGRAILNPAQQARRARQGTSSSADLGGGGWLWLLRQRPIQATAAARGQQQAGGSIRAVPLPSQPHRRPI